MTSRTEPRPVDFRRPPQLPFASWITLQDWRHNLAARTVDNWNRRLQGGAQLRVLGAESMLARDLGLKIADPGWGAALHVGPNSFATMFAVSQRQILALSGSILGAGGSDWPAERPLSTVEETLARMLIGEFGSAASEG